MKEIKNAIHPLQTSQIGPSSLFGFRILSKAEFLHIC
jgi:hypothetical protein